MSLTFLQERVMARELLKHIIIVHKASLMMLLLVVVGLMPAVRAQHIVDVDACATMGGAAVSADGASFSFSVGQACFRQEVSPVGALSEGVIQVFCDVQYDTLDLSFCQNSATTQLLDMLPAGYMIPASVLPSKPGYYEFGFRTLSVAGCDSVVLVRLKVLPTLDTVLRAQGEGSYTWFGETLVQSGTYTHMLQGSNGCDSVVSLELSLMREGMPLPHIYSFQSRLLMVDRLMGGTDTIEYDYYRWYRDDVLIGEGADLSTYSENGSLLYGGCYHVQIATNKEKTHWVMSNTICIDGPTAGIDDVAGATTGTRTGQNLVEDLNFDIAPNPVAQGGVVNVRFEDCETLLRGAQVAVYNVHGQRLSEQAAMPNTVLKADWAPGIYTVHLLLPNGRGQSKKLIVK